jgi:hypothetical protein
VSQSSSDTQLWSGAFYRNIALLMPAVILFVVLMGVHFWRASVNDGPTLTENGIPISPEIEDRFGVRFTGLHVLARGGLVDLRYRVIDAGKAKSFGHYTETSPLLIDEESGRTIEVTIMGLHNHRVETGRIYYILFRNTGDILHSGDRVTIQVDDLALEHFVAQ